MAPFATALSEAAFVTAGESIENDTDPLLQTISSNPTFVRATLRPYQVEGVNWLVAQYNKGVGGIIGDGMFTVTYPNSLTVHIYTETNALQCRCLLLFDFSLLS